MLADTEVNIALQRLDLVALDCGSNAEGVAFRYAAILGALGTFFWGAFQYFHGLDLERAKQRQAQEAAQSVQKIAASQPFLTLQLKLFQEATETAALLATTPDSPERARKRERFEQLYWANWRWSSAVRWSPPWWSSGLPWRRRRPPRNSSGFPSVSPMHAGTNWRRAGTSPTGCATTDPGPPHSRSSRSSPIPTSPKTFNPLRKSA